MLSDLLSISSIFWVYFCSQQFAQCYIPRDCNFLELLQNQLPSWSFVFKILTLIYQASVVPQSFLQHPSQPDQRRLYFVCSRYLVSIKFIFKYFNISLHLSGLEIVKYYLNYGEKISNKT